MHLPHAKLQNASQASSPISKVVCVGRNYAEHARELNNPIPTSPILFIKPATAVVDLDNPIALPQDRGEVHYEAETALLLGKDINNVAPEEVREAIQGVGVALDLTLRGVQSALKEKGHPWEIAKSFDGACPLSSFAPLTDDIEFDDIEIKLSINNELRQQGASRDMLTPIDKLVSFMSRHFTLLAGDVILTGTPAGVGVLNPGDRVRLELGNLLRVDTEVKS